MLPEPSRGAPSARFWFAQRRRGRWDMRAPRFGGTPLLCSSSLSTTVLLQLRSRLSPLHLTALHRGNHYRTMWASCSLWDACCSLQCVHGAPWRVRGFAFTSWFITGNLWLQMSSFVHRCAAQLRAPCNCCICVNKLLTTSRLIPEEGCGNETSNIAASHLRISLLTGVSHPACALSRLSCPLQVWGNGWVWRGGCRLRRRSFSPSGSCNRSTPRRSCSTAAWTPGSKTTQPECRWVLASCAFHIHPPKPPEHTYVIFYTAVEIQGLPGKCHSCSRTFKDWLQEQVLIKLLWEQVHSSCDEWLASSKQREVMKKSIKWRRSWNE